MTYISDVNIGTPWNPYVIDLSEMRTGISTIAADDADDDSDWWTIQGFKIGRRTELRAHDGTEDGPCARDVEELDHEDLPSGHYNVVQPIGLADGGRHAVVRAEYALNKAAVEDVT